MPSLYLSASLFTSAELAFNRALAAALRSAGFAVFLPQEIDQTQDQKAIFDLNVRELNSCDLVLAIVDGPDVDSGVAWEMGYAFATCYESDTGGTDNQCLIVYLSLIAAKSRFA